MENEALFNLLNRFSPVSEEHWRQANISLTPKCFKKGECFVSAGEPAESVAFVKSGLCRTYYLDREGKEYTKFFQAPGVIAAPYSELILGIPARCYIQAVVNTEILVMQYADFLKILNSDMTWQLLSRKIAEHFFVEKDQREYELLQFSADQRYDAFLERYAEIESQIPKNQIASYLGITAVAFSRLLAKRS